LLFEKEIIELNERNPGILTKDLVERPLSRGIFSSTISFSYQRQLFKKIELGVSARRLTRGLRSDAKTLRDTVTNDLFSSGIIYRLHSYELGLFAEYDFLEINKCTFSIRYMFAYDAQLILRFNFENFESRFASNRVSGSERGHARFVSNNFGSFIKKSFEGKFYRFNHYLSINTSIKTIIKNLKLHSSLTFGASTRLRIAEDDPVRSFLPDGNIIYASIDIGISYSF